MNCKRCGKELETGSAFCKYCGEKVDITDSMQEINDVNVKNVENNDNQLNNMNYQCYNEIQSKVNSINEVDNSILNNNTNNIQNINLGQNYNNQSFVNNAKSKDNKGKLDKIINNKPLFISILILLVVIILGLFIFIMVTITSENKTKDSIVNNITTTQPAHTTTTKNSEVISNSNVETLGGYQFTIPNNLTHTIESGQLVIKDGSNSFATAIYPYSSSYEYFQDNIQVLITNLESSGMSITNYGEKNYYGLNYLTIDFVYQGTNGIISFCKLSNNEVTMNMTVLNGATSDYAFQNLGEVLKTAKKIDSGTSSEFSISSFSKNIIDFES